MAEHSHRAENSLDAQRSSLTQGEQSPTGSYEVSSAGTGPLANEYVITRRQLDRLAKENNVDVGARSDDVIIARLARLVETFRHRMRVAHPSDERP